MLQRIAGVWMLLALVVAGLYALLRHRPIDRGRVSDEWRAEQRGRKDQ